MIARGLRMAFHFPEVIQRTASEAQVFSLKRSVSGKEKPPASKKYINYKYLSSLNRPFPFSAQEISSMKVAPFPLVNQ